LVRVLLLFARRPGLYRPVKQPVTLRLDVDLAEWFKRHAPEGGQQSELGRVSRRYVAGAGRLAGCAVNEIHIK
jgi:uncharacterized protein (DUF4415 family)